MGGLVWLVQNALFGDEFGYDHFIAAIDQTGDKRIILDSVFWEATIDLKLTDIDPSTVIPFGTRSFTSYARKVGWKVFWDETYEYASLLRLGEDFINHDMTVAPLSKLQVPDTGKAYIREAAGFNIFKGKVISGYSWPQWAAGFLSGKDSDVAKSHHDWHPIDENSLFAYAPVKVITDEWRVWIINDKVASASQYVVNGVVKFVNADENWEVIRYAQSIANRKLYDMHNYVLDIFKTPDGLRVGEINCIHCSGWYAIDARKVVQALAST